MIAFIQNVYNKPWRQKVDQQFSEDKERGKLGLILNRYEVYFENDQNVLVLDCCDDIRHSEYTKNH